MSTHVLGSILKTASDITLGLHPSPGELQQVAAHLKATIVPDGHLKLTKQWVKQYFYAKDIGLDEDSASLEISLNAPIPETVSPLSPLSDHEMNGGDEDLDDDEDFDEDEDEDWDDELTDDEPDFGDYTLIVEQVNPGTDSEYWDVTLGDDHESLLLPLSIQTRQELADLARSMRFAVRPPRDPNTKPCEACENDAVCFQTIHNTATGQDTTVFLCDACCQHGGNANGMCAPMSTFSGSPRGSE